MKKQTIYTFLIVTCFISCQNNKGDGFEKNLQQIKRDTIQNSEQKKTVGCEFYELLTKENGNISDTILIKDYKMLLNKNELFNMYIWDRINTISQSINTFDVYADFEGTYLLKPNHNKQNAQATKVVIKNDSCYLYKANNLIIKDKFLLINSSDELVKGKFSLERYKIRLLNFSSKVVILNDNLCADCEELQFYKIK